MGFIRVRTSPAYIAQALGYAPPSYLSRGGKLAILLAQDADTTLNTTAMWTMKDTILAAGFRTASLDLPAHGADATAGVQPLDEWRNRIAAGDTILFTRFAARLSRLIDTERATEVSVVGLSRGGYCACVAAALDPRIKYVYLNAPVTDLQKLTEFNGYTVNQSTFGLSQYTAALSQKAIKVRIYATDTRVDSTSAQSFAASVGASLDVVAGSAHGVPDSGEAATWLLTKVTL